MDSWGQAKEMEAVFYAIDKEGPPLLLGMPGLAQEEIIIDSGARTWRFKIEKHTLELVKAHKFGRNPHSVILYISSLVSSTNGGLLSMDGDAIHRWCRHS